MAHQTFTTSVCRSCSSIPTHNPSHQSRTPTTLISSRLHHPHLPKSPRRPNLYRLPTHLLFLSFTILLTCIAPLTSASSIYIPEQMVETPKDPAPERHADSGSALSRLAQSAPLLVDLSPPPPVAHAHDWTLATVAEDLRKRQVGGNDEEVSSTSSTRSTSTRASATTRTSSSQSSPTPSIEAAEDTGSSPLPQIFDSGFNSNITESCANFMNAMLANETFQACLPFSLLLRTSNTFFQITRSVTLITRLLDHTCAANTTICTPLLTSLATNLTLPANCASDFTSRNPLITQAHLGLLAYPPIFTASCLRNPSTSSYCYADAMTNKSSPTDGYVYYLPLNDPLPTEKRPPTCSSCLRDTMAVFSGSENRALASTYGDAARLVNAQCGAAFVNASMAVVPASGAVGGLTPVGGGWMGMVALGVVVMGWLL